MFETLVGLLTLGLGIYFWLVIAHIVVSIVVSLGVLAEDNIVVTTVHMVTNPLVETVLVKIRTMLPFVVVGPLDLSPLVLLGVMHLVTTYVL